jgi:hypothetical protein
MPAARAVGWLIDHLPDVTVVPAVAVLTGVASWLYAVTGYAPPITRKENTMPLPAVRRRNPDDGSSPWLCSNADGCDAPATTQWPVSCDGADCPTTGPDAQAHAHPMFGCDRHPQRPQAAA